MPTLERLGLDPALIKLFAVCEAVACWLDAAADAVDFTAVERVRDHGWNTERGFKSTHAPLNFDALASCGP
jgi:hypothetical protein